MLVLIIDFAALLCFWQLSLVLKQGHTLQEFRRDSQCLRMTNQRTIVEYRIQRMHSCTYSLIVKVLIDHAQTEHHMEKNLHQSTSPAKLQNALEAHRCKPWMANISIVPTQNNHKCSK